MNFAQVFGTIKLESLGYRMTTICVILDLTVLVELRLQRLLDGSGLPLF